MAPARPWRLQLARPPPPPSPSLTDGNVDDLDALEGFQEVDEETLIADGEKGSLNTSMVYSNALRGCFGRVVVDEGHNIKVSLATAVDKPSQPADPVP